jgi:ferredoxin-thioredoxin reductase catalytic subunit
MILDSYGKPARSSRPQSTIHAFEAAKSSGYRGWFYFPSLNPQDQMPQWTREEINRKVNWLYNNVGAVVAVIDGLALDEVDTGLWPKPCTSSAAFNAAVKHLWQQQCGFNKAFSADGENNFYSAQYLIRREIRLRGDMFAQKLRSGEAAASPQLHFLPGYQCGNAVTGLDQSQWRDGRMDNPLGRALQWRFQGPDAAGFLDVSASDCIHFHDPFLLGQKRGMSALASVARKLFSIDDIEKAETSGVLLRTRIAYAIERVGADGGDGPTLLPGTQEVEELEGPAGNKVIIQKIVANDGTEVEVADLPPNQKLRVVESVKSTESSGWISHLLADVAYCTKYPPEYIFALASLSQGTLVRMAQQKVQRVVNTVRDFQIITQLLDEWWPFWLWDNIKNGRLDNVRGGIPDQWWPYLVVRPKDLTVDMGREGRLYDERLASGKMPVGLYVGMLYGEDEEDFDDAIIRDAYRRRRRVREIGEELQEDTLSVGEIFRQPPGTATVQDIPPDNNPDDAPPAKNSQ